MVQKSYFVLEWVESRVVSAIGCKPMVFLEVEIGGRWESHELRM